MNKFFYAILIASRPKTLFASISPVLIGLAYTFLKCKNIELLIAAVTLLTAVLLQCLANIINDLFDYLKGIDTEKRTGPLRTANSGLLSIKQLYIIIFCNIILIISGGIFLTLHGGIFIFITGIISITFAFLYTTGPYPLSHHALGELTALVFFGIVPTLGTYYLQTKDIDSFIILLSLIPGIFAAIIMAINNLRDIEQDNKANKKTLASILGEKMYAFLIKCLAIIIILTLYITIYLELNNLFIFTTLLVLALALKIKRTQLSHNPNKLNQLLAQTSLLEFIYASLLFIFIVFR
jgi:1,4-dihydroxy-2-naphthoate octaprenyltransferase